jgi:6-phosphofructokinase 1
MSDVKMNIAVAQSGGPTCAINASLAGVYKCAVDSGKFNKIYGALNGITGVMECRYVDLSDSIKNDDDLELLIHTPSTALGSCRYKLPDAHENRSDYEKIIESFRKFNIGMFFYIGGNDSMDTVMKLSHYFTEHNIDIKVIGIPKTIDNDLCGTDHSPGFGSAAKYVLSTIQEIVRDSRVYGVDSVTVIEVMGRHAGWLTASSCCLRANGESAPHLIYLPEGRFSREKFIEDVKKVRKEHKAVIVAVSEGVCTDDGNFAAEAYQSGKLDAFGHKYLSGIGKYLENLVSEVFKCKVRSIELNVMQRCSAHLASATDLEESEKIGAAAVDAAISGKTGCVMTYVRESNEPYTISIGSEDASSAANHEKHFPKEWLNSDENDILPEAIEYFLPLIQGEVHTKMKNGMPVHFAIK